jgi:hypothetical protein
VTERDSQNVPLENLLRAAMSARAEQVTTEALRAPAPPVAQPESRNRLRAVGIPLAIVTTLAAAYGAVSLVSTPHTDDSAPARQPTSIASPPTPRTGAVIEQVETAPAAVAPQPSAETLPQTAPATLPGTLPTGATTAPGRTASTPPPSSRRPTSTRPPTTKPPSTTPSTAPTKITDARAIKVTTAGGWRESTGSERSAYRCFGPADTADCDLDTVKVSTHDLGDPNAWPYDSIDTSPSNWASQPVCAKNGRFTVLESPETITPKLVTKQNRTVAGRSAVYREVLVTCAQGQNFTVRIWVLADQGIDIIATSTDAKVDAGIDRIVSTLDLAGYTPKKWTSD